MDLTELLKNRDGAGLLKEMKAKKPAFKVSKEDMAAQYDVSEHDIFDESLRKRKETFRPKLDSQGQPVIDTNGNEVMEKIYENPTRIGIPFQEIIVNRAVGFLNVGDIDLSPIYINEKSEEKVYELTRQIWRANKLDFRNVDIARKLFSECEVAELWYLVEDNKGFWDRVGKMLGVKGSKFLMKSKVLAESNGDKLYPYFDSYGDMTAFGREYTLYNSENKEVSHFDVYTEKYIYKFSRDGGTWALVDGRVIPNPFEKIPVIYYRQDRPEWYRVQSMIDQLETRVSNTGDANDYYAYPMLFVKGVIKGMASKGERGKVLQGDENTDAKHLTWSEAAESLKLEVETLEKFIYSMTQTPNISFEEMKNLGDVSGIALKLMFLDAHMKANNKKGIFGEGIQRRLNLIKAGIGNVLNISMKNDAGTLEIEPKFKPYLPSNDKEDIENLSVSVGSGIMSKETAMEKHPLVDDTEQEMERAKNDQSQELSQSFV